MRVPCSASSRAARSASVKTVASRQDATRFRRTEVSPASAASLVCMSVQKVQPLIWLARIRTSSGARGRQRRLRNDLVGRDDVVQYLGRVRVGEEVQAGLHGGLLCRLPMATRPKTGQLSEL